MTLIKKFKNFDNYTKLSVVIIILFSIIVLALTSIYHVSGDACWILSASKFMAEDQKIPLNEGLGRNEPFWSPPLFHIIGAIVYSVFGGFANTLVKFISPIFAIMTLILTFLIVKRIYNTKISSYALIFLASIPLFLDYSVFSYAESMLTFFVVLSVYFAIKNKILLTSVAAGLGILTKYNALFIIPVLIYIIYKNNKTKPYLIKNILTVILLPLLIASPWLIRNWILLGNPIWPFLNFIFHGTSQASFTGFDLSRFTDINLIISTYLGLFGVPNGDPKTFLFFDIPFLMPLLTIWLIGTLIFTLPLIYIFFIKKIKNKILLLTWIILYIILFLLYIPNVGFGVTRIIIPAIPALAIVWAHGFNRILSYNKKIVSVIFILIISGFVFAEFTKITLSAREWNLYSQDFEWIKSNTNKNNIFIAGGQCIPYNIDRQTVYPESDNIDEAEYVFVNQDFRLDRRTIIDDKILSEIKEKSEIVYKNERTKTEVYRIKQ